MFQMSVEIALKQYCSVINDQVYYDRPIKSRLGKTKQFKNDTERLNAFHNILWLNVINGFHTIIKSPDGLLRIIVMFFMGQLVRLTSL